MRVTANRLRTGCLLGTVGIHQPSGAQRPWRRTVARAVTWAGAGGEGPDSASWLACLQRELEAREDHGGEGLWCGPEKLPTLQATGGWGAGSVAGLEKQGPRKAGDVWCGPGKAWRGNLWCLEKHGPGEATRLWSLEKRRCGGRGLTTTGDMMRAGDCQQGSGGKEGEARTAGAGDSGQREGSRRQRQPNGSGVLFFFAV